MKEYKNLSAYSEESLWMEIRHYAELGWSLTSAPQRSWLEPTPLDAHGVGYGGESFVAVLEKIK